MIGSSPDSPVEGDAFEPSVPLQIRCRFQDGRPVSHDGLTVSRPGTRSSNPVPSSDESAAKQHLGNATGLVSFLSDLLRLQHALPDGFHHIRHYGFLANRHRSDKLARCRELFSVTASALAALDWALLGDATQSTAVRS